MTTCDSILKNISYYELKIYMDSTIVDASTIKKYKQKISTVHKTIHELYSGNSSGLDAGFDLFVPESYNIIKGSYSNKINHGINKEDAEFELVPEVIDLSSASSPTTSTLDVVAIDRAFDKLPLPLILTVMALPGEPEFCATTTPEERPCNACSTRSDGVSLISSAVITETAPFILLLFSVP